MSRTAKPIPLRTEQVTILVPWLHGGQRQVHDSQARFKIVVCGRQWGKTTIACVACIEEAATRGGSVWWVAPHYKEGELAWQMLKQMCRPYEGVHFEGRPIFRATFPHGGGTVQVRSAEDPDALRGATLSGVVLDEAAQIREEAWNVIRPTLAVQRGWAMFISTPRGLNWFYDLYNLAGERDEWARWRFPSTMNPRFDAATWDLERAEMHPLVFAQEYEAEFVQAAGTVFRREWFRYWYPDTDAAGAEYFNLVGTGAGVERIPAERCMRFATVDLAFSVAERADYTVIASWAVTPDSRLVLLGVEREHMEGERFLKVMESVYGRYRLAHFAIESAAKQRGLIRDAERLGLPVREVRSDSSKESRALPAAARMERAQVFFPQGVTWMRPLEEELLAFPAGAHDDFVDTLAYAVLHLPRRSAYERRGPLIL